MSLLLNVCKYEQCGRIFPNLNKLIAHIEATHINFNPQVVEFLEKEKPAALPLSYVLPSGVVKPRSTKVLKSQLQQLMSGADEAAESEAENDDEYGDFGGDGGNLDSTSIYEGLNSDEDLIAEFIVRYGTKPTGSEVDAKPYACPVPGCMKRYKNVNGIKYHSKHGHRKNSKPFECYCGKGYKTHQGLKNHMTSTHGSIMDVDVVSTPETTISTPDTLSLHTSALDISALETPVLDTSGQENSVLENSALDTLELRTSSATETLNLTVLETLPSSFDELCQISHVFSRTSDQAKHKSYDALL